MIGQKIIIVFALLAVLILGMVSSVKASDIGTLPIISTDGGNNEENTTTNNVVNNSENNNEVVEPKTNIQNTNSATDKLPQTGVSGDTALYIFGGVCVVSAIYAYIKIRKYNGIN